MVAYRTHFEYGPAIQGLYDALAQNHVLPKEMDIGWAGKHERKGVKDGVITDREVIGYCYDHWQKFQHLLENHTTLRVVWSLDDSDPGTAFDAEVRERVNDINRKISFDLVQQGIPENSRDFRIARARGILEHTLKDPFFFKGSLSTAPKPNDRSGGLVIMRGLVEEAKEATALEFLQKKLGSCTEKTKALFGIYGMLGIPVRAIDVTVDDQGRWTSHLALEVEVNPGEWKIVDPSLGKFDPKYQAFSPLTNAEFAGAHYENFGTEIDQKRVELLYPRRKAFAEAMAHFNSKNYNQGVKELRLLYPSELDPRPELYRLLYIKGHEGKAAYQEACEQVHARYPGLLLNLSQEVMVSLKAGLGRNSDQWCSLMQDLAQSPEEKKQACLTQASYYAMTGKAQETFDALRKVFESPNASEDDFEHCIDILFQAGHVENLALAARKWHAQFPDSFRAANKRFLIEYQVEQYDEAIRIGTQLMREGKLIPYSCTFLIMAHAKKKHFGVALALLDHPAFAPYSQSKPDQRPKMKGLLAFAKGDLAEYRRIYQQNLQFLDASKIYEILYYLADNRRQEAELKKKEWLSNPAHQVELRNFFELMNFLPQDVRDWFTA